MINPNAARVQMHLPADRARQKGFLAAIFAIADDRMADRRHMHTQLMRAAGMGLQLYPGGAVARAFDEAITRAGGQALLLIELHLLATRARLLGAPMTIAQ